MGKKEFINTVLRDTHLDMQDLQKENPALARIVEEYSKKLSVNRKENWDGTVSGLDYRQFDEITAINDLLLVTLIQNCGLQIQNNEIGRLLNQTNDLIREGNLKQEELIEAIRGLTDPETYNDVPQQEEDENER